MHPRSRTPVAAMALAALALACGGDTQPGADAGAELTVIDGFQAPEDLELLPSGDLLVAEYGGITGAKSGTIKLLRPGSQETVVLYPSGADDTAEGERWGDPACEGVGAALAPHGVHLAPGPGGGHQLLVVNHAERESIELFEVQGADTETPRVVWRGCVVAPEEVWLNDVAALPGGGFVATHMTPRGTTVQSLLENSGDAGLQGYVLEWSAGDGWQQLPGTEGLLINGVTTSPDGAVVYANHYLGDKVVAYERSTGTELWSTPVDGPDNPSWTADGTLLIASHREDLAAVLACHEKHEPFCGIAYGVVEIDPETGAATELFAGAGAPFGGATVAVLRGDTIYLGSFTGERIGVLSLAETR